MTPLHVIGGLALVGIISHRNTRDPHVYRYPSLVGKVLKEADGVSISVNPVAGFAMGELVATGDVAASPSRVADLLWDMKDYPAWMPRVKAVDTILPGSNKRIDYFVFEAPGGNRDIISEAVKNEGSDKITIKFKQKDDVKYTPKQSLTRLTLRQGIWELTPNGAGGTSIKYKLRADPGVDMNAKVLQNMAAKGIIALFDAIKSQV